MPDIGTKIRPQFDWTRDPPPANVTPFQTFIRNVDWENSPLGPMKSWPNQLRQMVLVIVADPNPAVVYWGDEQAIVYNEAYIPLIGQKHPNLLGQNPRFGGFAEIWDQFDHVLTEGERTGEPHMAGESMLLLMRHGFLEECYFTWKFIPMIGEEGFVVASYATVLENTRDVISSRRMSCIKDLSRRIASSVDMKQFWPSMLAAIEGSDKDVPLAMVYSVENEGRDCELQGSIGIEPGHPCAPVHLRLDKDSGNLSKCLRKALSSASPVVFSEEDGSLPNNLFHDIKWRGFAVPSKEVIFCPVVAGDMTTVLVLALNPRRKFDVDYQNFIYLLSEQLITPHVLAIGLAAEVEKRKDKAEQASRDQELLSHELDERTHEFEQSEMRFRRFADRAPIGLCITTNEGTIVHANQAWYDFTGINPQESGQVAWMSAVVEEDLPVLQSWWEKVTIQKASGTFQIRSREPFKAYSESSGYMETKNRTGLCAAYADLDTDGNVTSVMGLIVDISEIKWVEEQVRSRTRELERGEEKYRRFAEHAPIGVCRFDRNGTIDFVNKAWSDIFEQQNAKNSKTFDTDSLHPEDVEKFQMYLMNLWGRKAPPAIECRLKRPYGVSLPHHGEEQQTWILASGHAEASNDGTIQNVVCWVTNISAQKAAEKTITMKMEEALDLKRQQERFIDMISHEIRNPMSAVLHCAEEIIQSVTQSLADLAGDPDLVADRCHNASQAAQTVIYCVEHQRRLVDDVLTLSKLDSDLINIAPVPVQSAAVIRQAVDIFERDLKAADILLRVIESHSLVELGIEWLMLDPNRFLQVLINLVTNAIKFTRSQAKREITIAVSATKERPDLYTNEIEYFPRSAKRRSKSFSPPADTDNCPYLIVSVTDTGIGLADNEKKALFRQFAQASPKTSIKYGGTGLGLFICRQISEMMGGDIGVASEAGKGSTFTFFVKACPAAEPAPRPANGLSSLESTGREIELNDMAKASVVLADLRSSPKPPDAQVQQVKPTLTSKQATEVLVVEDNLINQRVLCRQLRNRGYIVESANHGEEGLDALQAAHIKNVDAGHHIGKTFDMVLCDIEMPVLNGIGFVRQVRKLEMEGVLKGHLNVIAVTANARSGQVDEAIRAGMDGVTTKPYRMDELVAEMDRLLSAGSKDTGP